MSTALTLLWLLAALGVFSVLLHWPALFLPAWAALTACGEYLTEERCNGSSAS